MAPSLDVNATDEDESNKSIVHEPFHKPSSENIYMDVSESECNIVNKILSQNNSSDVLTIVITELKYDEHLKPSVSDKGAIYFNIFQCGRNLLDQFDVMYQRAFTASAKLSSVPKGHYEPSPSRERYYDMCADHIVERNDRIDEDELRNAFAYTKFENEEEHERNIKDMIQDDDYKSPWEIKDATVATGLRTITYSSYSDKNPTARKEPIKDTQTLKEPIKGPHLGKNSFSFNGWTHQHGPSRHRIRYHWTRKISDY